MPESSLCDLAEEGDLIRVRELTARPFACRESSIDDMRRRRLCPDVARRLPESVDQEFAFRFATAIATQTSCERTLPRWVNVWVEIQKTQISAAFIVRWRKGWDSNPRYPCGHAGFQDRCLKPLGHPSVRCDFNHLTSRNSRTGEANCRLRTCGNARAGIKMTLSPWPDHAGRGKAMPKLPLPAVRRIDLPSPSSPCPVPISAAFPLRYIIR